MDQNVEAQVVEIVAGIAVPVTTAIEIKDALDSMPMKRLFASIKRSNEEYAMAYMLKSSADHSENQFAKGQVSATTSLCRLPQDIKDAIAHPITIEAAKAKELVIQL